MAVVRVCQVIDNVMRGVIRLFYVVHSHGMYSNFTLYMATDFSSQVIHLLDGDTDLAKVALVPLVLVRLLGLLERERLVNDRLDVVGLDSKTHILELRTRADEDTPDGANVHERINQNRRLVLLEATNEANDGDDALELDSLERVARRAGAADLNDVVDADAARQLLGRLAPVRILLVVDDVVRAQLLQLVHLVLRARRRDDSCARGFGELDREDTDAAGSLCQHPLTRLQLLAFDAVEGVPGCETRTAQGGAFDVVEVRGLAYDAVLVVDRVLLQSTVNHAADTAGQRDWVDGACEVALVEEREHLVAFFPELDLGAHGDDFTGCVRGWDDALALREWVAALKTC